MAQYRSGKPSVDDRRDFLKKSGFGFFAALLGTRILFRGSPSMAQGKLEMVKESDPQAKALGYYEDAKKVDTKKWPKRAGADGSKQFCYNCQFYQHKDKGDPKTSKAAPCTIFAGKGVAATGWCNTWTQNPAVKS